MPAREFILVIGALFLIPVLFCLVGAGILVHMASAMAHAPQPNRPLDKTVLAREMERLQQTNGEINKELQQESRRLLALVEEAQAAERRAHVAQTERKRVEKQAGQREAAAASLEAELAILRRQVNELDPRVRNVPWNGPVEVHPLVMAMLKETESSRRKAADRSALQEGKKAELETAEEQNRLLRARHDGVTGQLSKKRTTFTLVPPPGTNPQAGRHAMFVECTAEKVIIQPAGRALSAAYTSQDQTTFLRYARKADYVGFLIRPDGFRTFQQYRQLVRSENNTRSTPIAVGFEPVDAHWTLAY